MARTRRASGMRPGLVKSHRYSLDWIRNERAAPALFEIMERADLPRHFQFALVNGIVPSLDVDAARIASHPQYADDVGPVRIAKPRRAMPHVLFPAANAARPDDVPGHRRILAVDVMDFLNPLAQLRQRIDERNHLVARLPLQAESGAGYLVEHHLPGRGRVGDIHPRVMPPTAHVAILESDPDPAILRAPRQLAPHLPEPRHRFLQRPPLDCARETRHDIAAKKARRIQATREIPRRRFLLERIAVHPERTDNRAPRQDIQHLARRLLQFHSANAARKRQRKTLETVWQDLRQNRNRRIHLRQRADAYVLIHSRLPV